MIYKTTDDLDKKEIKYFVMAYIDQKNELHFETNCINSIFMIGMVENLKIEVSEFLKQISQQNRENNGTTK